MKERQAKREYAHVLVEMMKDIDGFKINAFDFGTKNNYQRRIKKWKKT